MSNQCQAQTRKDQQCKNRTIERFPYCWLHTRQRLGIDIKPSHIPNANKGLFAIKTFKKGDKIVPYTGEVFTEKELQHKYGDQLAPYAFKIDNNHIVDAIDKTTSSLGRYANDCTKKSKKQGYCTGNNAKIFGDKVRHTAMIKAIKPIKKGQEIYVNYGKDYWKQEKK